MKKTWVIFLITLLFIQISLVSSQDVLDLIDIGLEVGFLDGQIKGIGIETKKLSDDATSFKFIIENAILSIKDNLYINIIPHGTDNKKAYINIDKNAKIIQADFTTNDNGGNYTFGNKTYEVPPNSRVYFSEETGVEIEVADGTDLSKFSSLLDYVSGGYYTIIRGKDITLPNGIHLIDGEVSVELNGYLLKNGEVNYKQNLLNVNTEENSILIASRDANMLDYDGNWIRQTSKTLEIQSDEKGYIKVDFLENHEILNTDDRDKGYAELIKGDGLKFINRNDEGLIPQTIHKSSDKGYTSFVNDKLGFEFDKNKFVMDPPKLLTLEDIQSEKYQSIAMEVESDSPNIDGKLRINSYRQFCFLSKDNEELVTFNKYGLPCSALLKDNELQTLAQLREKYKDGSDIKFLLDKKIGLISQYTMEESVPPYLIYLTDYYLTLNPDTLENLKGIHYSDGFGATMFSKTGDLYLGRKLVDPNELSILGASTREFAKEPIQVLTHEYEHRLDGLIKAEESQMRENPFWDKNLKDRGIVDISSAVKNLKDPELKRIYDEIEIIKKGRKTSILQGDTYDIVSIADEIEELEKEFEEVFIKRYGSKMMLQQKYNEIIINARKKFVEDEENLNMISKVLEELDEATINKNPQIKELFFGLKNELDTKRREEEIFFYLTKFYDESFSHDSLATSRVFQGFRNNVDKIMRTSTGLPYKKSLEKGLIPIGEFAEKGLLPPLFEGVIISTYPELSSTYREQSCEQRRRLVNSANPIVREVYITLTQLAFDSGKMDVEEYKAIMGERYCKRADCSDKLCVEYKLLCCIEHPNSPNC